MTQGISRWIQRTLTWGCPLACALAGVAGSQTLDEQYQHFLGEDCRHLSLERDEHNALLPGQVGPNLAAFCFVEPPRQGVAPRGPGNGSPGPPLPAPDPGPTGSMSAVGGSAGTAAGRGGVAAEDVALRERREQGRDDGQSSGPGPASEISLVQIGRAGAFFSLDRQYQRQRVTQFEAGRRFQSTAAAVGVDYRFGSTVTAGFLVSYADISGDFAGGGDFTTRSRGVWSYGSWLPADGAFIDVSAGIDTGDQRARRLVGLRTVIESDDKTEIIIEPPLRLTDGSTTSRARGTELSGGYDFFTGNVTIGPRVGVAARRRAVGGFIEGGDTPMALAFDRQTVRSLITSVGAQVSRALALQRGALVAQLNLDWHRELRDDQRVITARLAEDLRSDPTTLSFLNQPPDRTWGNVRASLVTVFSNQLSGFVSLESTFGHAYLETYRASFGVRREF